MELIVITFVGISLLIGGLIFIFPSFIRGEVIIKQDQVGIVTKKPSTLSSSSKLAPGQSIARKGEVGIQAETLSPGLHHGYHSWKYKIDKVPQTVIPVGKIGLVYAKDGTALSSGEKFGKQVEDCDNFQNATAFLEGGGQMGRQLKVLLSGSYQINTELFEITLVDVYRVKPNQVGIVTTTAGKPIPQNSIAGEAPSIRELKPEGHNSFQDGPEFIEMGGYQGLQEEILKTGDYNLNPWFVSVEQRPLVEIPAGTVGVLISNVGEEADGELVQSGYKGIRQDLLRPGRHAINTEVINVILVPINPIALDWSNKEKPEYNYDAELRPLQLLSKDGFSFDISVTQLLHIDAKNAPKMITKIGVNRLQNDIDEQDAERNHKYPSIRSLITKVLEPTVEACFRAAAAGTGALEFQEQRKEYRDYAADYIEGELEHYGVNAVNTLINEIGLPDKLERHLQDEAEEMLKRQTYIEKQATEEQRQILERAKADFDLELSNKDAEAVRRRAKAEADADQFKANVESEKLQAQTDIHIKKREAEVAAENEKVLAQAEARIKERQAAAEARTQELEAKVDILKKEVDILGQDIYAQIQKASEYAKITLPQITFSGDGSSTVTDMLMAKMMIEMNGEVEVSKPSEHMNGS